MVDIVHLNNAPITEAIIDIRTNIYEGQSIEVLQNISNALPNEYSDKKPLNHILTELIIKEDDEPHFEANRQKTEHVGYICRTENEKNIAQVRFDGLTFSELTPYSTWNGFSSKAKNIWQIYCSNLDVPNISRLAVRYINHMEFPMSDNEELAKYLTTPPAVPGELPSNVSNFLTRITITDKVNNISANVIQAMKASAKQGHIDVLLDIDVFQLECGDMNSDELWDKLIIFRKFKNTIFFEYITEEAVELFR